MNKVLRVSDKTYKMVNERIAYLWREYLVDKTVDEILEKAITEYIYKRDTHARFKAFKRKRMLEIYRKQGKSCYLCGLPMANRDRTLDHLTPLCRGGRPYDIENLAAVHESCNKEKGALTLSEYRIMKAVDKLLPD